MQYKYARGCVERLALYVERLAQWVERIALYIERLAQWVERIAL